MMNWGWGVVWGGSWGMVWGWSWGVIWSWMSYNWNFVSDNWVNSSGVGYYWSMDNCWSVMWLVDSMGDDWSMTMLDSRVATDISGGNSQKSGKCDKGLHVDQIRRC
jgi:hypothetical protein